MDHFNLRVSILMPAIQRYSKAYRSEEIVRITEFARQGQSSAFVGIAGVGKSNISRCLQSDHSVLFCPDLDIYLQIRYLNVDCNDWDGTLEGCWRLLRENMENAWGGDAALGHDDPPGRDYLVVRKILKNACQKPHSRVVIILDDCDRALNEAPQSMTDKLRTLRDDHRDQLSYLLFTKHLPHRLGPTESRLQSGMFFQLFHNHIFTLRPYNERDAMHMLEFLNRRASISLRASVLRTIYHLSGGYAALIRTLFETYETEPHTNPDMLTYFSAQADTQTVIRRFLNHLHRHEQYVLHRLACNQDLRASDAPAVDLLRKRGVLRDGDELFSPIITQYLRNQSSPPS